MRTQSVALLEMMSSDELNVVRQARPRQAAGQVDPLHLDLGLHHFRAPQDANRLSCLCCEGFSTQLRSDLHLLHSLSVAPGYLVIHGCSWQPLACWNESKGKGKAHILFPSKRVCSQKTDFLPSNQGLSSSFCIIL